MLKKIKNELMFDMFKGLIFTIAIIFGAWSFQTNHITKSITSSRLFVISSCAAITVLGTVFVLYPLCQLISLYFKDGTKEIEEHYFISDKELLEDYKTATGDGRLRSSVEFSYYKAWDKTIIIPNKDIVWAYKKQLTKTITRVNHNRVRSEEFSRRARYSIIIRTIHKKSYEVQFFTEDAVDNILNFYKHIPTMVVGYSDEYKELFTYHFDKFLEIKYNQG